MLRFPFWVIERHFIENKYKKYEKTKIGDITPTQQLRFLAYLLQVIIGKSITCIEVSLLAKVLMLSTLKTRSIRIGCCLVMQESRNG